MDYKVYTDEEIEQMSFETALDQLEIIVEQLESGNVPLEKAINLFQDGMKLAKKCHIQLEDIEQKIEVLIEQDGEFMKKPFEQNDEME